MAARKGKMAAPPQDPYGGALNLRGNAHAGKRWPELQGCPHHSETTRPPLLPRAVLDGDVLAKQLGHTRVLWECRQAPV